MFVCIFVIWNLSYSHLSGIFWLRVLRLMEVVRVRKNRLCLKCLCDLVFFVLVEVSVFVIRDLKVL